MTMRFDGSEYRSHDDDCDPIDNPCSTCEWDENRRREEEWQAQKEYEMEMHEAMREELEEDRIAGLGYGYAPADGE